MKTALLWLLLSMPTDESSYANQPHAHVVERFTTAAECQRMGQVLRDPEAVGGGRRLNLRCIQARVVVS